MDLRRFKRKRLFSCVFWFNWDQGFLDLEDNQSFGGVSKTLVSLCTRTLYLLGMGMELNIDISNVGAKCWHLIKVPLLLEEGSRRT